MDRRGRTQQVSAAGQSRDSRLSLDGQRLARLSGDGKVRGKVRCHQARPPRRRWRISAARRLRMDEWCLTQVDGALSPRCWLFGYQPVSKSKLTGGEDKEAQNDPLAFASLPSSASLAVVSITARSGFHIVQPQIYILQSRANWSKTFGIPGGYKHDLSKEREVASAFSAWRPGGYV